VTLRDSGAVYKCTDYYYYYYYYYYYRSMGLLSDSLCISTVDSTKVLCPLFDEIEI